MDKMCSACVEKSKAMLTIKVGLVVCVQSLEQQMPLVSAKEGQNFGSQCKNPGAILLQKIWWVGAEEVKNYGDVRILETS